MFEAGEAKILQEITVRWCGGQEVAASREATHHGGTDGLMVWSKGERRGGGDGSAARELEAGLRLPDTALLSLSARERRRNKTYAPGPTGRLHHQKRERVGVRGKTGERERQIKR